MAKMQETVAAHEKKLEELKEAQDFVAETKLETNQTRVARMKNVLDDTMESATALEQEVAWYDRAISNSKEVIQRTIQMEQQYFAENVQKNVAPVD